jgi:hypothetical protein
VDDFAQKKVQTEQGSGHPPLAKMTVGWQIGVILTSKNRVTRKTLQWISAQEELINTDELANSSV